MASREDKTILGRLKWLLSETPDYEGDDPRAVHYRLSREALQAAIDALSLQETPDTFRRGMEKAARIAEADLSRKGAAIAYEIRSRMGIT